MASIVDYKSLRNSLNAANDLVFDVKNKLQSTSNIFEDGIIVGGKSFDNGEIQECISLLNNITTNFTSTSNWCNAKIQELLLLQQQASNGNDSDSDTPSVDSVVGAGKQGIYTICLK